MSPNYLQEIYFIPKTDIYWKPNSEFLSNIISIFYNDDSNKHSLYNNTYELMYFDCDFKEALNYEPTLSRVPLPKPGNIASQQARTA